MSSPSSTGRKRSRPEDWSDGEPSPVIHIRGLPKHTIEVDLMEIFQTYGWVRDVAMMPQINQALIEFDDIRSAETVLKSEEIKINGHPIQTSYSNSKHIVQRASNRLTPEEQKNFSSDNHVLLFTIYNVDRQITVDVIHQISVPYGNVARIVIFRKAQLQAMVEFKTVADAKKAKLYLNGADIFPDRCTLKIDYARPTRLTVHRNDLDSWDFEKTDVSGQDPSHPGDSNNASNSLLNGESFPGRLNRCVAINNYQNGIGQIRPQFQEVQGGFGDRSRSVLHTPVIMLYNIDMDNMNCDRVFNLLCVYGNVLRIKFLKSKQGSAMVEMGDVDSAMRTISNFSGVPLMGQHLVIRPSKQEYLTEAFHPHSLPDGSPSFKDYSSNHNNRYSNTSMARKNRIYPPSTVLHYWNAPPDLLPNTLDEFIKSCGAPAPRFISPFSKPMPTSSSGTIEWATDGDAILALAVCNHREIMHPDKPFPFILKLAFANPVLRKITQSESSVQNRAIPTNGL